jgi:CHAT domain-containing protein
MTVARGLEAYMLAPSDRPDAMLRRTHPLALAAVLACGPLVCLLPAQVSADGPAWRAGTTLQRRITGAAPDVMRIPLAAGQFIRVEVIKTGVILSVTFRDPSGSSVTEMNSGNGPYGPEIVVAIAETAGEYTLEVKRSDSQVGPNEYTVTARELREAVPADLETVAAYRNYAEAEKMLAKPTAEASQRAIGRLSLARDFFSRSGDRYMEGLSCFGLGFSFGQSGEFRKAIPWYEKSAALFNDVPDRYMEARILNFEGGTLGVLGEPQEALKFYQRALVLFSAVGDRPLQALMLNNVAVTEAQLSEWQSAMDHYRQVLPLFREAGDRVNEGRVLVNMGAVYQHLGNTEEALRLFGHALPLRREASDKAGEATTLNALANAHLSRQEPAKSLEYVQDALALWRSLGDRREESESLRIQGQALTGLGRFEESKPSFLQALDLARAVGDRRRTGQAMVYLSAALLATGEQAKAVDYGDQAVTEFRAIGDRRLEAISLETIARAESARGNLDTARRRMEEALAVSESARQGTDSQQLRASFFATRQDSYGFYINLLMRIGGLDALALESSERSRARSLLEMLAASGTAIREGADAKLLERERDISNLLNAKGARLLALRGTGPQAAALTQEVRDLESEYQDVQAAIRKSSPRYASVMQPSVLTAQQIRTSLLDRDTLLLEYSLCEERSYLWVVSKDGLQSFRLPARAKIEAQAIQVSRLIAARAPARALEAAASELSRMVLGGSGPALGGKRLLIVPDGALQSVPFAMLPEPGTHDPLVVRHEVVMTPSASALAALRTQVAGREPAPKTLAVFADPVFDGSDPRAGGVTSTFTPKPEAARLLEHVSADSNTTGQLRIPRLPYTAQEAEQILRVVPDKSNLKAVGFDASRATAIGGQLSEYKYLHFATHGYLDTEWPELSALVLSQIDSRNQPEDGFLRVDDIYNARLSADLVVLSACQTGLGKEVRGEGLMGLTRAFLYAGVPRVIVSLWNVNDQATAELMADFYKNLLRGGKRPSEALREAQLELRKQKRWESPYYWAAFVQHGDWQ